MAKDKDFFDTIADLGSAMLEINIRSGKAESQGYADGKAGRASDGPYLSSFTRDPLFQDSYDRGYKKGVQEGSSSTSFYNWDPPSYGSSTSQSTTDSSPGSLGCGLIIGLVVVAFLGFIMLSAFASKTSSEAKPLYQPKVVATYSKATLPTSLSQAPASSMQIGTVQSTELNVRSEPNPDKENILFVLRRGDQVRLTQNTASYNGKPWVLIESRGRQGWVNKLYLNVR